MLYDGRFRFNNHAALEGTHAILSASNYHWINDSDEKFDERLSKAEASSRGTRLHAWAAETILLGRTQPRDDNDVLSMYVNDAIDLGMVPEQMLFYSVNAYGTADAIGFEPDIKFLRIHDFKSGVSQTSEKQLYVYAGFFCLEYDYLPFEIDGELRIYQSDEIRLWEIDKQYLSFVYDRIKTRNDAIEERRRNRRRGGLG